MKKQKNWSTWFPSLDHVRPEEFVYGHFYSDFSLLFYQMTELLLTSQCVLQRSKERSLKLRQNSS